MDHSPLGRLPRKIRNEIYAAVSAIEGHLQLESHDYTFACPSIRRQWAVSVRTNKGCDVPLPRNVLALVSACRQLHNEARSVFFAANAEVIIPLDVEYYKKWLVLIRPEEVKAI